LVVLCAAVGLLLSVQGAALAVSGIAITPGGAITVRGALVGRSPPVECAVTLSGSLARSLVAISGEGAQLGSITGMTSSCTKTTEAQYIINGVLNTPWTVRLKKLTGLNPRFALTTGQTEATLEIVGFSVNLFNSTYAIVIPELQNCLYGGTTEAMTLGVTLRAGLGRGEYAWQLGRGSFEPRDNTTRCNEFWGPNWFVTATTELPSTAQTLIFLVGGEVIEGVTPRPVEFGRLAPEELAQRNVTISSLRGGRIESIRVFEGRYFTFTDPNSCRGMVLAEGGSCTIRAIVSAPSETGRALNDNLTVTVSGRTMESQLRAST
jgi:hypothetical protein